jgi:hypothetical protein
MSKRILLLFVVFAVAGGTVWAVIHFVRKHNRQVPSTNELAEANKTTEAEAWFRAVEKVKAARDDATGGGLVIPPELRHYSERYWFLATQVAEIEKYNVYTCQDFLDLAAVIQRGEMVAVPAVTDSYVLFGVGEKADDGEFTRYVEDEKLEPDKDVKPTDAVSQQNLLRDYESLQFLAKSFLGRSYDLNSPTDRHALRINMLRSLRPQALKILEEVASSYHRQFDRPLHVSSLVRPEQYQRALNRVNRNAVLIDSPPHSTGLAFDIDYRYMSAAEQTFLMAELARLKQQGRIEVIRERNANYHVFAFIHGTRPSDDLITASLEKARPPGQEAHHAAAKPAQAKSKVRGKRSKVKKPRANVRRRRH